MELTHAWKGYGSAIFLEFGDLAHKVHPNGRQSRNPFGEMSVSVEWSWRIEGRRHIWLGSWNDQEAIEACLPKLVGSRVRSIGLFGRIPEIDLELSTGLRLLSFMTTTGEPEWAIRKGRDPGLYLEVRHGRLRLTPGDAPRD